MTSAAKTIDTLVTDIQSLLVNGTQEISDELVDQTSRRIALLLRDRLKPREPRRPMLRMSNIGRNPRQLWYEMNGYDTEEVIDAPTRLKFLYGDLVEELVLFLVEASGHTVTDRQRQVSIEGITGHLDCRIDGAVADVKSASPSGYNKFYSQTLYEDDSFGYVPQISGYSQATGGGTGYFLAVNKVDGEMCLMPVPPERQPDVAAHIRWLKEAMVSTTPPDTSCSTKTEDNGNTYLTGGCVYCKNKDKCHVGLRVFDYSNGPRYFTKVVKEPRVAEIRG